ncbi:MAG: GNAT family N-acetyltransferase [Acidobacteria bacterium]|nr:GNAT family N-acetyltransferase [Acidobacteriota bacterium]
MTYIRAYAPADWPALLPIVKQTFESGDTYAFPPDISDADIHKVWIETPPATFVAVSNTGEMLGTYYIKPNQPGLGAHVCNCGYIVSAAAAGQGIATQMCEHSQRVAVEMGFRAMQFNLVVSTNRRAVELWERLGFVIVGRLPGAFPTLASIDGGFVDTEVHVLASDAALVTARFHETITTRDGITLPQRGAASWLWRLRDDEWTITYGHVDHYSASPEE